MYHGMNYMATIYKREVTYTLTLAVMPWKWDSCD